MRDLERVYIRDDRDQLVHARYRANVGPLHSPAECRVEVTSYTFVPDLRGVPLTDLHGGCFVGSDHAYRAEQDPEDAA